MARAVLAVLAAAVMLLGTGLAGPDGSPAGADNRRPLPTAAASPVHAVLAPHPRPAPEPVPTCAPTAPGFSCGMQDRIRRAERYLAAQPGRTGIVLHDRRTGATWRNANARADMPAASTIKLAVVTDLLLRDRSGAIRLTGADRSLIYHALHESSDVAADQLWFKFEDGSFARRARHFGMADTEYSGSPAYWGYMYCTAEDLDRLMNFVIRRLPAGDRDYLVHQLRHVAPIQQWGVWGAGAARHPGNKNGWEYDDGVWIVNTVGFAGPHERYTLAIMDDLGGNAGFATATNTLSQVAALLFRGHPGPRPTARATE